MTVFILDTDHLGIVQRSTAPHHAVLTERMRQHRPEVFFVTVVSFHEQINGWNAYIQRARSETGQVRGYAMFQEILSDFVQMNVLPLDSTAAATFVQLRSSGIRVGTMDLRIGSIGLVHGFTVLTRNTIDFQRIPGLQVADWTLPER